MMLSATELADRIRRRRVSPVEVIDDVLARIARLNPRLNAYLAVFEEEARAAARRAEQAVMARRRLGALHGVPLSIKDLVRTVEGPTTAGSRIFGDGLAAGRDAPVVRRLRRAGAIVLGKTNLHEVALGVTSENEHFGPVRNPWAPDRVAGGSSGGSAAAVAAGLGPLSLGTDTRGSIRIPSACCGITGFKPTRGLVPLDDVVPLSGTLDHAGPMARTAADCGLMLGAMVTPGRAAHLARDARRRVRGLRVGVSAYHVRDLDAPVQGALDEALGELRRLGCRISEIVMPDLEGVQEASVVITASEAIAFHDRFLREEPSRYGPAVRERLEGGYRWTALDYLRALAVRERVARAFAAVFTTVDCLVGATIPALPPRIGAGTVRINGRPVATVENFTRCNAPQNMAGIPALALPCGATADGIPLSIQVIAGHGRDAVALALGVAFQRVTDWHRQAPPVA